MSRVQAFWKSNTTFPENTQQAIDQYHVIHTEDLAFLQKHYPHFFEPINQLKGRKLNERLKFEQHMQQLYGQIALGPKKEYIKDDSQINIWIPEAYAGNLEEAKLLIMLVNPKYNPIYHASEQERRNKFNNYHVERPNYAPNEFIDGQLRSGDELKWHYNHMYQHIEKEIGYFPPNQLMTLQYFAYASYNRDDVNYLKELLPSQIAAMETVREAMDKGINIIARSTDKTRWFSSIPELATYKQLFVFTNYKQPSLLPSEIMSYETFKKKSIYALQNTLKHEQALDWQKLIEPFKES